MVLSSLQEGGANVISEAVVSSLPVIASDISGTRGLLGPDYPGYFPTGDDAALAAMLLRAEEEPAFLQVLLEHGGMRAHLFSPARERDRFSKSSRGTRRRTTGTTPHRRFQSQNGYSLITADCADRSTQYALFRLGSKSISQA